MDHTPGCTGGCQAAGPALRQGGLVYRAATQPLGPMTDWHPLSFPDLAADDFFQILPNGSVDTGQHPDFGPTGGLIELGFVRGNSTGGAPVLTRIGAIDNWEWRLCPATPAVELPRPGIPFNPNVFLPGVTSGPVVGATWDPVIDHTSFLPNAVVDVVFVSALGTNLPLPPLGTLLCDISQPPVFFTSAPGVPFALPIPASCDLVGATACSQGASASPTSIQLTNALDVTIGSF